MSLYNKYRPQSFSSMIGNMSTITSIQSIISKKNPPHSFLFTGASGTGKTTAARILAKELGCDEADIEEVDSADCNGVDFMRELKVGANYLPQGGKKKAYILDEVQKLSSSAQSALLKCLEEPPEHVLFFLATTDPQKLLKTIKTRCTEFNFSLLDEEELLLLLKRVCKKEKKEISEKFLKLLAEKAQGFPRQALSLLEKYIDIDPEQLATTEVQSIEDENTQVIDLCRALIAKKPWKVIAGMLKGLKDTDPETIRKSILGYCSSCLLNNMGDSYLIMDCFLENTYDSGMPRIVAACYESYISMKK